MRKNHFLYDNRQIDLSLVKSSLQTVDYSPVCKQRRPALADKLEDSFFAGDVQIGGLLSCKGGCRKILRRGAGTYGISISFTKLFKMSSNLIIDSFRNSYFFDRLSDFCTGFTNTFPIICF